MSDAPITVSIVEDNARMREGFAGLLNRTPGLRCVSSYATAEDALRDMPARNPEVALVDVHLPGMNGVECVAALKKRLPQLQVLMFTRYEQSDLIFNSIRAGASGYLLKSLTPDELIEAIEHVHAGGAPMSMQIARKVAEHFRRIPEPASETERLTPREKELVELLARGYDNQEISGYLGITLNQVRAQLHAIYQKLHLRSRNGLAPKPAP